MLFFIYFTCNNIMAWSFSGHEAISEIAYQDLSTDSQEKLDAILDKLIIVLPADSKALFKKQPAGLSKLAKLSIMPDYWKRMKFNQITDNLDIHDSNLLYNLNGLDTANWHYTDKLASFNYSNNYNFIEYLEDSDPQGKLAFVVKQLLDNLKNVDNDKAKALGIVYTTHLIGDAHQPLHGASKGDKGGNLFCLIYKQSDNRCKYNLHQYWDSAGKYLDNKSKHELLNIIKTLNTELPKNLYDDRIYNTTVDTWLDESYGYWRFVYSTKEYEYPNKSYETNTRKIARDRIKLAGYRLSDIINSVVSN